MSKVKRLNKINNWDVLDTFYGHRVNGFAIKVTGFERTFCRCGNVMSKFEDKCDKCGNFSFITRKNEETNCQGNPRIEFSNGEYVDSNFSLNDVKNSYGDVSIKMVKKNQLLLQVSSDVISFRIDSDPVYSIGSDGTATTAFKSSFMDEDELKFLKESENFLLENMDYINSQFKDLLETVQIDDDVNIFEKYLILAKIKATINNVFSNVEFSKHPFILKALLKDFCEFNRFMKEWSEVNRYSYYNPESYLDDFYGINTFRDFLKVIDGKYHVKNDDDISLLDICCKDVGSLYSVLFGDYESSKPPLNSFLVSIEASESEYKDIIYYYVSNGLLHYYEGYKILKQIRCINGEIENVGIFNTSWKYYLPDRISYWDRTNYKDRISFTEFFEPSDLEYFDVYLKENIHNRKEDLMEGYIEQIINMKKYKIDIKPENFKIKTFNYLMNQACLADIYRLPQAKVDMFIDMFEINPLEALSLISNRRKMTKKEVNDFLEIMTK